MATYKFLDKIGLGQVWEKFKNLLNTKMPNVTFGEPVVLVDTTTVNFSKDGDNDWYISAENPVAGFTRADFQENTLYKIEWDGVEYEEFYRMYHKPQLNSSGVYSGYYDWGAIGCVSPLGYFSKEMPFLLSYDYYKNSGEVQFFSYDTQAVHTVKITKIPYTKIITDENYYTKTHHGLPPIRFGSGGHSTLESAAIDASGAESHAEGAATIANGFGSHAEGGMTATSGGYSHAEGAVTVASGNTSHAEGQGTTASGRSSHAEGLKNLASGGASHAEGQGVIASGNVAHAEGNISTASGFASHAEGEYTIANHRIQHVFGGYNIADPSSEASNVRGNYVEIVGNGTADDARSNARTLDWDGNEILKGKLTIGTAPTNDMDVTTKQYVDTAIGSVQSPPEPVYYINITSTEQNNETIYAADKTFEQITSAYEDGLVLVCIYDGIYYSLNYKEENYSFDFCDASSSIYEYRINEWHGYRNIISIYGDNSISYSTNEVPIPQNIAQLSDTTISSPANGQFLQYNSTSSKWENKTYTAPVTSVNGQTGAVSITVPTASSTIPSADGTGAVGTSTTYARADHVHPKITQTISISSNVITLTGSDGTTSSVTLPVYNGGVSS